MLLLHLFYGIHVKQHIALHCRSNIDLTIDFISSLIALSNAVYYHFKQNRYHFNYIDFYIHLQSCRPQIKYLQHLIINIHTQLTLTVKSAPKQLCNLQLVVPQRTKFEFIYNFSALHISFYTVSVNQTPRREQIFNRISNLHLSKIIQMEIRFRGIDSALSSLFARTSS